MVVLILMVTALKMLRMHVLRLLVQEDLMAVLIQMAMVFLIQTISVLMMLVQLIMKVALTLQLMP